MNQQEIFKGALILWRWGDREVENPGILETQLEEIYSKGFFGVFAGLRASRYEVIDRKVVTAVTEAGQWAKNKGMDFWFQADPRQASRYLITKKNERMQNLIVSRRPENGLSRIEFNFKKVENKRYELRYYYPQVRYSPWIQEVSLSFEPSGVERIFLFRMKNGVVLRDSITDITSESRFFTNIAERYVEVFGEIQVPKEEEWWVMAFPRFDTNLYDYAGRGSNDHLSHFIEDLFDAGAYIDGMTWDDAGYIVDIGRFPVSLSLYNCFIAEYGYDLRDVLYGLVLEVNDGFHVRVRCDYYKLLMDIVYSAQKEFYQIGNSFLGNLEMGLHHVCYTGTGHADGLVRGNIDPWRGLESASVGFTELKFKENTEHSFETILSTLVKAKSLGIFSRSKKAFCSLWNEDWNKKEMDYLADLMGLFSVQWVAGAYGYSGLVGKDMKREKGKEFPENPLWKDFKEINRKIDIIRKITGFRFAAANTVLVFPMDTIMAGGSQETDELIFIVNRLIAKLIMQGVQLDVISPVLLKGGRLYSEGLRIGERMYDSVIFPYPEVLDSDVLEIVSVMDKLKFPILLGGSKPKFTTNGKRIPHVFRLVFNPEEDDLSPLFEEGVKHLIKAPVNGFASMIRQVNRILFLVCPKEINGAVEGEVQYGEISFAVPKSSCLVIYKKEITGDVKQVF